MIKPELSDIEDERLRALKEYQILDTLPEQLYDDITQIAAQICNVPVALISLIDEKRQWFKSSYGLDASETDKDLAFCAHAINRPDEVLEVPDAFEDERFHDNPLVTGEPHVRFYAGAPLKDDQGYALGTLCVIDNKARNLTTDQKKTLQALSRQVVALLQLRKENIHRQKLDQDFNDMVENLGDGIFELDSEGKCVYANAKMLTMLNREIEEVINTSIWEMIYHKDVPEMKAYYGQQFKNKELKCYYEYRIKPKGRDPLWVIQNTTMQYEGSRMVRLRTIARDLSETKLLQKELREKDSLYKLVSENSRDLIAIHEPDATYKFVSPSSKDLLGYKPSELVGKNPYDLLIHPEDTERLRKGPHTDTLKGSATDKIEYRIRRKDNTYLWMESYTKPIENDKGEVVSFQTSSRDISDKKLEQIRNEKYKDGLTLLNELASKSRFDKKLIDDSLRLVANYLNLSIGMVSKMSGEKYVVRNFYTDNPDLTNDQEKSYEMHKKYCEYTFQNNAALLIDCTSDPVYSDYPFYGDKEIQSYIGATISKNGEKYGTVNFSDTQVRQEKFANYEAEFIQLFANWIGSVMESREERKQLEAEKLTAEAASEAKANFLSMMSHEIRTPLNGIIGTTHLLLSKSPQKNQMAHLNILKQSGDNLLAIVNDILDFNKIEEGKLMLDYSVFNFKELVDTIYKNYVIQAKDKNVEVILDFDKSLSANYLGDAVRISQVLHNLMSNAVKFTNQGEVSLIISKTNQHDNFDEIFFEVRDSGIGISKDKQKEIFEVFVQSDRSITRKYGGSGLGLSITKRLLVLMDSEIEIESVPEKGASFSFKLVLARQEASDGNELLEKEYTDLAAQILIVEDNAFNMAIAKDFLESWGCKVTEAQNGKEALKQLESKEIDLVLLDLQMPIMDGYETIHHIRQRDDAYYRELPVLALTAAALGDEKEKVFQSGMNDFITKPFHPKEFYSKLSVHLKTNTEVIEDSNWVAHISKNIEETLGSNAKIEKYLNLFIDTTTEEVEVLKTAIETKDFAKVRMYAHKNRSGFKLIGLDQLASDAEKIQNLVDKNSPKHMILEKAQVHYDEVVNLLNHLKQTV